jgi:hypothetical protein
MICWATYQGQEIPRAVAIPVAVARPEAVAVNQKLLPLHIHINNNH